jgi:hypothetical protein
MAHQVRPFVLLAILLAALGCSESKTSDTAGSGTPAQDSPFTIYKSPLRDDSANHTIRFISEKELEWTMNKGGTIVCPYTVEKNGSLRVIVNVMGTSNVFYLEKTAQGYSGQLTSMLLFGEHQQAVNFR